MHPNFNPFVLSLLYGTFLTNCWLLYRDGHPVGQCKRSFKYQPAVRLQKRVDSLRVDCRRMWMVCKTCAWKPKWEGKPATWLESSDHWRRALSQTFTDATSKNIGVHETSSRLLSSPFLYGTASKKVVFHPHKCLVRHISPQLRLNYRFMDRCTCNCALPVINSSLKRSVTRRSTKGCTNCSPHRAPLAEPYLPTISLKFEPQKTTKNFTPGVWKKFHPPLEGIGTYIYIYIYIYCFSWGLNSPQLEAKCFHTFDEAKARPGQAPTNLLHQIHLKFRIKTIKTTHLFWKSAWKMCVPSKFWKGSIFQIETTSN